MSGRFVLALVGMGAEARIARRAGLRPALGAAAAEAAAAREPACRGLVSFGIAGGLDPALRPGDLVLGRGVVGGGAACDPAWTAALAARLPGARVADILAADRPAATRAEKARLFSETGAVVVDLESGAAARAAAARGLPLAVLRAVADPAERALPASALAAWRPEGGVDLVALLAALARRPAEAGALLRLAADAARALRALRQAADAAAEALAAPPASSRRPNGSAGSRGGREG